MAINVTYPTALRFWDALGRGPSGKGTYPAFGLPADAAPTPQLRDRFLDVCRTYLGEDAAHEFETTATDVLTAPGIQCRRDRSFIRHQFGGRIPAGSFVHVAREVFVASPSFAILMAAAHTNKESVVGMARLVRRIDEACGLYSLSVQGGGEESAPLLANRGQLVTRDALVAYSNAVGRTRGAAVLRAASELAFERSRSPMETSLVMQLCLPYHLGGFHLSGGVMNARIDIPPALRGLTDNDYFEVDLCFPHEKLAVEYDSSEFHAGFAGIERDAKKRNALEKMGWKVVTVTAGQLGSEVETERVARIIASDIHQRIRCKSPSFSERKRQLRWVLAYGGRGDERGLPLFRDNPAPSAWPNGVGRLGAR